ncbi:MAG: GNAT family N-acetyltransferase [Solimonas sp.]
MTSDPASSRNLFTDPAYIGALEASGCAAPDAGWTPRHIDHAAGRVWCYEKAHSWGEFVFDFEIARVYQQMGLRYYPKLVACVPFTPVPGARLLVSSDADAPASRLALARTLRAQAADGYSGAHALFVVEAERELLEHEGWIARAQPRYVWHAHGAADFDGYLARLSSKKRKNIRAERRKLAGLDIQWRNGDSFSDAEWRRVFRLYANTYAMRGQEPYLNLDCLRAWAAAFGAHMPFCLALHDGRIVALAFFFEDGDTLYGRHWGAAAQFDGLHFELCYYQGIERCFARGLAHFDAGVQGEHKLARGFAPTLAWSAHWFAHEGLHAAVARAFSEESARLRAWVHEADQGLADGSGGGQGAGAD